MRSHNIFKIIFLCTLLLPLPFFISNALAECALVLTSPADGAVFTGSGNQVTIYGYVKAEVDPGYGYIELTNNGQYVQRWEGTFTSANYVLESGAAVVTLSEGKNRIEVVGDAAGCLSQAYDAITVYYTPGAETGPDANLGGNPEKGDGPPKCQNFAGDPVNIATGNVTAQTADFSSVIPGIHPALQLSFARSYNSRTDYSGPLGHGWTHTYDFAVIPSEAVWSGCGAGADGCSIFRTRAAGHSVRPRACIISSHWSVSSICSRPWRRSSTPSMNRGCCSV